MLKVSCSTPDNDYAQNANAFIDCPFVEMMRNLPRIHEAYLGMKSAGMKPDFRAIARKLKLPSAEVKGALGLIEDLYAREQP